MSRAELDTRAGRTLTDDDLTTLSALGIVFPTKRGRYEVAVSQLSVGLGLLDLGFPTEAALAAADVYAEHGRQIAKELNELFRTMVWPVYKESGRLAGARSARSSSGSSRSRSPAWSRRTRRPWTRPGARTSRAALAASRAVLAGRIEPRSADAGIACRSTSAARSARRFGSIRCTPGSAAERARPAARAHRPSPGPAAAGAWRLDCGGSLRPVAPSSTA